MMRPKTCRSQKKMKKGSGHEKKSRRKRRKLGVSIAMKANLIRRMMLVAVGTRTKKLFEKKKIGGASRIKRETTAGKA